MIQPLTVPSTKNSVLTYCKGLLIMTKPLTLSISVPSQVSADNHDLHTNGSWWWFTLPDACARLLFKCLLSITGARTKWKSRSTKNCFHRAYQKLYIILEILIYYRIPFFYSFIGVHLFILSEDSLGTLNIMLFTNLISQKTYTSVWGTGDEKCHLPQGTLLMNTNVSYLNTGRKK